MKKLLYSIVLLFSISLISQQIKAQVYDVLSMGPGYALDEYYSLENGTVKTIIRTDWDISFFTDASSSGISINGGAGVVLYTYPHNDTSAWANIDTSGMSTWPEMVNSEKSWEEGAFVQNATGHPDDYGWGVYDSITQNLIGDSMFIIKLVNETYMKLWIVKKQSTANIYTFRFANLNGSGEQTIDLDCSPYVDKNFIYYSLETNTILDRDPPSDSWDLIFTKYNATLPNGLLFIVTGILTNKGIGTIRMADVDPLIEDWGTLTFQDSLSNIGFNWKYFDLGMMQYFIVDSLVYFVQNFTGDNYKLVFDGFDGMSTGNAYITKKLITNTGFEDLVTLNDINVFPNPASDNISIKINMSIDESAKAQVIDMLGQVVYSAKLNNTDNLLKISTRTWNSGLYFVSIQSGDQIITKKVLVERN